MKPCCLFPIIKRFLTPTEVVRECQRCEAQTRRPRTWPDVPALDRAPHGIDAEGVAS